jgi:hypothetical protein
MDRQIIRQLFVLFYEFPDIFLNNRQYWNFLYSFGFNLKKKSCRKSKYFHQQLNIWRNIWRAIFDGVERICLSWEIPSNVCGFYESTIKSCESCKILQSTFMTFSLQCDFRYFFMLLYLKKINSSLMQL